MSDPNDTNNLIPAAPDPLAPPPEPEPEPPVLEPADVGAQAAVLKAQPRDRNAGAATEVMPAAEGYIPPEVLIASGTPEPEEPPVESPAPPPGGPPDELPVEPPVSPPVSQPPVEP